MPNIKKYTREEALLELIKIGKLDDTETAHIEADNVLKGLLMNYGCGEIVIAFDMIDKWYS